MSGGGAAISNTFQAVSSGRAVAAIAIGLGVLVIGAAYLSTAAFLIAGFALLGLLGLASVRWPRVMLIVVVLSPALVDLYAGERLLPEEVRSVSRFFSEALLVLMTLALAWVGARRGTLVTALRHPFTVAMAVFGAISVASAIVNAVPPAVAVAGLLFTLDAAILFYLPRMVGYSHEDAQRAMWAIAGVVALASVLAIGQAVLSPDLLGLTPVTGVSGEGVRVGSLVSDPNILGTLIGMALPLTVFSLVRTPWRSRGWRITFAIAFVLALALLLTYSRGSWIGVAVGFGTVALIIDRRALVAFVVVVVLAYATAVVMPKGVLSGGSQGFDPYATTINRIQAVGEKRDLRALFVLNAMPIIDEHLLLGVGPGRYGGAAASVFGSPIHERFGTSELLTEQRTVDIFWLHLAVETGALGVAAFAAMIGTALVTPVRALRRAGGSRFNVPASVVSATAVVCVTAFTTMLLEGNTAAFMFWFLLGIGSLAEPAEARTGDPAGVATASAG
ncbi:MAG TPA: O-antigen ligase family protein [Candidatus Limnocylindria bacterium]